MSPKPELGLLWERSVVKEIQAEVTGVARGIEKNKNIFFGEKKFIPRVSSTNPSQIGQAIWPALYIYIYEQEAL